jgi:hypothetical protein
MSTIDRVLDFASRVPDESLRDAIVSLARGLTPHISDFDEMWTFTGLSRLSGLAQDDPILLEAIRVLASRTPFQLLDMHFIYFSPDGFGDGEPLDDAVVAEAYISGYLEDPRSGEELRNFEDYLVPYFQLSREPTHG